MGNELYPFYEGTRPGIGLFQTGVAWDVLQGLRTTIEPTEDQRAIEMPVCSVHLENRDKCDIWRV